MPDIVMACNMGADADTVWRAITSTEGVTGWFTARADIGEGVGRHHLLTFPEMPAPWDLLVEESVPRRRLKLAVEVGPPQWVGTNIVYAIAERGGGGITLNFDHNAFATIEGVREWTIGWATKVLALKKYVETGARDPFYA